MHDKQSSDENLEGMLAEAYDAVRSHELDRALRVLEHALSIDFDSDDVVTSMKFVNFWQERDRVAADIGHAFEYGEYYLEQWPLFEAFVERIGCPCEPCLFAVRQHVFGLALDRFSDLLEDSEGGAAEDPSLLLRIGRCKKGLGVYDEAVRFFEAAAAERSDDAEVIAELADSYALVNEVQASKAFFREAFFLEPQRVHLEMLESQMIRALVAKVREQGLEDAALREWIPVYGVLYGVFNVKREMRSIEYGKLKQSIYALEREMQEGRDKDGLVEPRLMNRYFWLIDHYVTSGEDTAKIDEVLLKLRSINERVYQQYTN